MVILQTIIIISTLYDRMWCFEHVRRNSEFRRLVRSLFRSLVRRLFRRLPSAAIWIRDVIENVVSGSSPFDVGRDSNNIELFR